ncbi:Metallo-dependent phosphatase-like protein [Scenedesmus sp. NREL 46B-D3]|nr:Metallo-dependent phosphatase-like protein [Scenedesmus sp. NREL 46B-D3]
MGLLSSLLGTWGAAAADTAAPVSFCEAQLPQMFASFVDHVVDTAYTGSCIADPDPEPKELPPLRLPAAKRLVAIGDLHGDLPKALRAFRLAGLIDHRGQWSGGDAVCVQVGDILDRGDQEIKLLFLLERLQRQAEAAGGSLHVLNGNHETMNVGGNFRYATAGADLEMAAWKRWHQFGARLKSKCSSCSDTAAAAAASISAASVPDTPAPASSSGRSSRQFNPMREAALRPGGPITRRFFAPHPTVLQVGSTLFVHGGVLPAHVEYGLERINRETRDWLMGKPPGGSQGGSTSTTSSSSSSSAKRLPAPEFLRGADAVVWARDYSARDEARCDCDKLQQVLDSLPGAQRMVVGHTIQEQGINGACGGRVLRVDVGLSAGCGNGEVQVLEITQDGHHIVRLRENKEPQVLSSAQKQEAAQLQQQQQQQPLLQPAPVPEQRVLQRVAHAAAEPQQDSVAWQQQQQQQQQRQAQQASLLGRWFQEQQQQQEPSSSSSSQAGTGTLHQRSWVVCHQMLHGPQIEHCV